jgi:hypothetical protein
MTFDRRSQFDRSFFDRFFGGTALPARIAGRFTIVTRTVAFTKTLRTNEFSIVERTNPFTVVAYK